MLADVVLTTPVLSVTFNVPNEFVRREIVPSFTVTAGEVPARVTAPPPLNVVPLKLWALMTLVFT